MENVNNYKGIQVYKNRSNKELFSLASESNYQTTKSFLENSLAIKKKKTEIPMYKPVYLCLSILQLSKIVMYEF